MVFNLPKKKKKHNHWPQRINTVLWCKMWQYLKPPSSLPLSFNFHIFYIVYLRFFLNSFNLVLMSHELLGNLLRGFCEGDIHLSSVEMGHILSTGTITLSSFWRVKEYLSPVPSPCFWERVHLLADRALLIVLCLPLCVRSERQWEGEMTLLLLSQTLDSHVLFEDTLAGSVL